MKKFHRWVSGMLTIGLLVSALSGCAALEALKALQKDPDNGTTQTDGDGDKLPDGSRDPSSSRPPSGGRLPGGGRDPAGGKDPTGLEDQADGEEIIPLEELSLEMLQEEIIQNGGSAGIAIIGYVDSRGLLAGVCCILLRRREAFLPAGRRYCHDRRPGAVRRGSSHP